MEVLFHLVFTLVKVAIQASVYATLLLGLVRLYGRQNPTHPVVRASHHSKALWWSSGFLASAALFVFSFTHWGHHGLGDYARIPLSHGEAIEEINGVTAYFEPVKQVAGREDAGEVVAYQVHNDMLCAVLGPDSTYYIYNLASKRSHLFASRAEYEDYARRQDLPRPAEFEDFEWHYSRYWHGWRFWLLA